jgi:GH25 family lysozyme M1 (1,4-beta-N-acetylmuramidase)
MKKITSLLIVIFLSSAFMLLFASQAMAGVQGIDVSRWQGTIDWDVAGYQTGFAIIKAGGSDEGMYTDSQFIRNRDEARRVGIARGYYYYAGGGDPIQEAEHFASLVPDLQPGEVLALDFEINHPDPVSYAWLFLVRTEQLTGAKPLFYTNMNRVWSHDWKPIVDNGNPLWGAIYDSNPEVLADPGSWPSLSVKQFTNEAVIPGINSTVDMNVFPSALEDFKAMGLPEPVAPVVATIEQAPEQAVPETDSDIDRNAGWETVVDITDAAEPERIVGIVPIEAQTEGEVETLTIKWPARRPVITNTSFEMDFAAALDS